MSFKQFLKNLYTPSRCDMSIACDNDQFENPLCEDKREAKRNCQHYETTKKAKDAADEGVRIGAMRRNY